MPDISPLPLRFTALRRFDVELGPGRVVAVFFAPTSAGQDQPTKRADQHRFGNEMQGSQPATATCNVVRLRDRFARDATHG